MPRVAPNVPADTDLLCEYCGYTLNGLPSDANCPECGKPVQLSISPSRRQPPAWETSGRFWATTAKIIFTPTAFFRTFNTRGDSAASEAFGKRHLLIASGLFAVTTTLHAMITAGPYSGLQGVGLFVAMYIVIFYFISLTTQFAVKLTHWEATYRGLRLNASVVSRGMDYHAAHYLPVSLIALATVVSYWVLLRYRPVFWNEREITYLYILSGEVIVAAGYLFNTYWIGMRNMMYANH